jgi:ribosomal protein S18 acetylase RimI-like enzyme
VEIAVRPATPDDDARLEQLVADAIAEQSEGRGGSIWSRREALREPAGETLRLVGTIDGTAVGYASVGIEPLWDGALLGVITAIFVEPGAREVAVGEALLDEVIAWCRARGCVGIDAHALPGNRETKNFFETFGFTARLLVVHRKL